MGQVVMFVLAVLFHVHVPKPEILEEQFVLLVEGELIEVLKHFLSRNFDLALNEVQGLDDVFW